MPFGFDVAGAIVKAVDSYVLLHRLDRWAKLVFTLCFSYCASFSFVCGSSLAGGVGVARSVGLGMIAGVLYSVNLFRRSDLTSGMIVALPAEEAGKEMDANLQLIQKK